MKPNLWIIMGPKKKIGYKKFIFCKCKCGTERWVIESDIVANRSRSCGCLQIAPVRHGMSRTKTHKTWISMKDRCRNSKSPIYKYYGARGILICERWQKFENFFEDMGHRPMNHTIDRIDNNGNYEPGNCRWATRQQQLTNTSRNIYFIFHGEKLTLSEISEEIGIEYSLLYKNIFYKKLDLEQAILKAKNRIKKPRKIKVNDTNPSHH